MQSSVRRSSSSRVDLDCPSTLLHVLWARHVWTLDVLPHIPALSDWSAALAHDTIAGPPPADADERCQRAWDGHVQHRLQPGPPRAPQLLVDDPDSETGRAMRAFDGATRQRALAGLRRWGPVTSDAMLAALAEQVDVPASAEVTIDVLPVRAPLCLTVAPAYFLSDPTVFTGTAEL